MLKTPTIFAAVTLALFNTSAWATNLSEISAEDYYGATYFKNALDYPAVKKANNKKKQIDLVAKDLKWKPKKLEAAIAKLDSLEGDATELAKDRLKEAFEGTRVKGRVLDILINNEEPKHVVLYVRWQGSSAKDVVKEASAIGAIVAKETPLFSTLSLAAIHPKAATDSKEPVWAGKIAITQMLRIQENRIDDYADKLYKPLFEGVETKPF